MDHLMDHLMDHFGPLAWICLDGQRKVKENVAVCQNPWKPLFCSPQNSWDLWMFMPLKMVLIGLIGIDPYPCNKNNFDWQSLARSTGKVYYDGSSEFGSWFFSHVRFQLSALA